MHELYPHQTHGYIGTCVVCAWLHNLTLVWGLCINCGDSNLEWNVKRVTPHPKVAHVVAHDVGSRVTADLEWNGIHVCVTFDLAEICICPLLSVFQAQVCM